MVRRGAVRELSEARLYHREGDPAGRLRIQRDDDAPSGAGGVMSRVRIRARYITHARPLLAAIALAATAALHAAEPAYDLVIRNARIVDGTGTPWYRGDLAIHGDTIAAIAPSIGAQAKRVIDV